jgi:hypothetical protein
MALTRSALRIAGDSQMGPKHNAPQIPTRQRGAANQMNVMADGRGLRPMAGARGGYNGCACRHGSG